MAPPLFRRLFRRRRPTLQDMYPQYRIGRGTYGRPRVRSWGEGATLRIGAFCSIADGVTIYLGGEHRLDWVTTYPFTRLWEEAAHIEGHPATKGDVVIGNDVWLGAECMILSGVTIGDGAAVGARAVVGSDVPPYTVVAGNPARPVKTRFEQGIVERLLRVRWWDWPDERIRECLPLLLAADPEAFLARAEREGADRP